MQSPYDLAIIKNAQAYFIPEDCFDLYMLKEKKELLGSAYANSYLIRSLLLKYFNLTEDLTHELYSPIEKNKEEDDKIFFIIECNKREKFFISFQIQEEDLDKLSSVLSQIKNLKSEIADWFRKELKLSRAKEQDSYFHIFPTYKIPPMTAVIGSEQVQISKVELTRLYIETKNDDLTSTSLEFSLGKHNYQFEVNIKNKSKFSEMSEYELEINFKNSESLKSWQKFIFAMELRQKKLNSKDA
jgi:hypothetical protein